MKDGISQYFDRLLHKSEERYEKEKEAIEERPEPIKLSMSFGELKPFEPEKKVEIESSFLFKSAVWGEMDEKNLSFIEHIALTELCDNADETRLNYLVHLYNERSNCLDPIEAHFVAKHAGQRGYTMITDENGNTKFEKNPNQLTKSL